MFDFALARTNLLAWATANYGGGLESGGVAPVVWKDTPSDSSFLGPGRIALDLINTAGVGWDEIIYSNAANPPPGEELDVQVKIAKTATLSIRIEIQDQRAVNDAYYYSQRLQDSLRFPSTQLRFSEACLAYARILSEVDLASAYQQRLHSAVQLDIRLNVGYAASDVAETYIETAEYTTEYRDADGNLLPTQDAGTLQLT